MTLASAAQQGNKAKVKSLLAGGKKPRVNAVNAKDWTPLRFPAWNGHKGVAKLRLSAGANAAVKMQGHDNEPRTAAQLAAADGYQDIVDAILISNWFQLFHHF